MHHKYIHPLHKTFTNPSVKNKPIQQQNTNFKDILANATKVKISKHAQLRLQERGIQISESEWNAIGKKMNEAKLKGVTDALVVKDDVTLVVSTKNNTVITAILQQEAENKIFTNINGTIFM